DCGVGLPCDNGGLAAKLVHAEAYVACDRLAERMLGRIGVEARLRAEPQCLVREAEQTKNHAVICPRMNPRVLRRQLKIRRRLVVLAELDAGLQLCVGGGKFSLREQRKTESLVSQNFVNGIAHVFRRTEQLFGKGLSLPKRLAQEIPGPQAEHGGKSVLVKPAFFAELKCPRIRVLHTVSAPASGRPEGIAERRLQQQLRLVSRHRVLD